MFTTMRKLILAICLLCLFGLTYPQQFMTMICEKIQFLDSIHHDYFSNCPCIAERKKGLATLAQNPTVGLSSSELIRVFGEPDFSKPRDYDSKPGQLWIYYKSSIALELESNKCVRSFPLKMVWH